MFLRDWYLQWVFETTTWHMQVIGCTRDSIKILHRTAVITLLNCQFMQCMPSGMWQALSCGSSAVHLLHVAI